MYWGNWFWYVLIISVDDGVKVLNVINSSIENIYFTHLFDDLRAGDVGLEHVEAAVDVLNAVALSGVALDRLEVFLRLDVVAMHWVDYHHLTPWSHFRLCFV